jgi:hypothetical protein
MRMMISSIAVRAPSEIAKACIKLHESKQLSVLCVPYLIFAPMRDLPSRLVVAVLLLAVPSSSLARFAQYSSFTHPDIVIPYYRGSRQIPSVNSELHATRGSPTQFRRLNSGTIMHISSISSFILP